MKKITPLKLSKRLTQYSALSLAIAGIADANGQGVVYTDITDIGGSIYRLDLNNVDPFADFDIRHDGTSAYNGLLDIIPGYMGNAILGAAAGSDFFPFALYSGYTISAGNGNWNSNYQYQIMNSLRCTNYVSNWCYGVTDRFLGLRFKIGIDTHYGWARLDVDVTTLNWMIKDYAYNSTPGGSIDTGEGILGVDDAFISKVKIVALNKSIALYNLPETTSYKFYTMTGQSVLEGKIENNTYVIEANTLASGVYIIELEDNITKTLMRKKIVL